MKFLQDIIKNPTEQKYLENDSYFTNYSDDYEDEGFWGYGMICQNSSTQSDIDVEVRYDEDEDGFLTLVIFNIDQIYDDNKDFFNKCLKDMGFHRTRQKEWVEFKQYIIEEKYWNDIVLDDIDVEDQVQEVAVAITKELFMRMEKAGIKPDKKEEEIEMENKKNMKERFDLIKALEFMDKGEKVLNTEYNTIFWFENGKLKNNDNYCSLSIHSQSFLTEKVWEIYEEPKPILNSEEKAYLEAVFKPFKDKIIYISKKHVEGFELEFIYIAIDEGGIGDDCNLPCFTEDTMYKGLELEKRYTLEELGLFKEEN